MSEPKTLIIKSKLNTHIMSVARRRYFNRIANRRYKTDPEYREKMNKLTKDVYLKRKRDDPKKHTLKRLFYYSRVRAKQKQLDNDLTYEWLERQIENKCTKTGLDFRYDVHTIRDIYAPSIDRIDNTKGYTMDNCQVVIWGYNCAKGPYTDDLLYTILKTLV